MTIKGIGVALARLSCRVLGIPWGEAPSYYYQLGVGVVAICAAVAVVLDGVARSFTIRFWVSLGLLTAAFILSVAPVQLLGGITAFFGIRLVFVYIVSKRLEFLLLSAACFLVGYTLMRYSRR